MGDERVSWQRVGAGGLRVALVRVGAERELWPVDALVVPMSDEALEQAARWAEVAAEARLAQGAGALRRHHHRRMEDLLIGWCNELEEEGREGLASEALGALRETRRIGPALALLAAGHDALLWRRLGRRRGGTSQAARNELAVRGRIHQRFARQPPRSPQELLALAPPSLRRGAGEGGGG